MKDFKNRLEKKIDVISKFEDDRLKYFAELLIFEEKPELLEKSVCNKVKSHLTERLLSKNKEKWLTINEAYKKIDDLRAKYDNTNNEDNLFILEGINEYIENLENKINK